MEKTIDEKLDLILKNQEEILKLLKPEEDPKHSRMDELIKDIKPLKKRE